MKKAPPYPSAQPNEKHTDTQTMLRETSVTICANANAHRPTLRLDLTVTSGVTCG